MREIINVRRRERVSKTRNEKDARKKEAKCLRKEESSTNTDKRLRRQDGEKTTILMI